MKGNTKGIPHKEYFHHRTYAWPVAQLPTVDILQLELTAWQRSFTSDLDLTLHPSFI